MNIMNININYLQAVTEVESQTITGKKYQKLKKNINFEEFFLDPKTRNQKIHSIHDLKFKNFLLSTESSTECNFIKTHKHNMATSPSQVIETHFLLDISKLVLRQNIQIAGSHIDRTWPLIVIPAIATLKGSSIENTTIVFRFLKTSPYIPAEFIDYANESDVEERELYLPLFTPEDSDEFERNINAYTSEDTAYESIYIDKNETKVLVFNTSLYSDILRVFATFFNEDKITQKLARAHKNDTLEYTCSEEIQCFPANTNIDALKKAYDCINQNNDDYKNTTFFNAPTSIQLSNPSFFDFSQHTGMFNLSIYPNGELFSLSLNQRIVVNSTTKKYFLDKEVLAVNGPPGTGKTTVIKSIIANIISEFVHQLDKESQQNFIKWSESLKIPSLLNIGCSFTKQAVNNVLGSLNFEKPSNFLWNQRWVTFSENEEPYILNLKEKQPLNVYLNKYSLLEESYRRNSHSYCGQPYQNIETILKEDIRKIVRFLNSPQFNVFEDVFYLNNNVYVTKNEYALSDMEYGYKLRTLNNEYSRINNQLETSKIELSRTEAGLKKDLSLQKNIFNSQPLLMEQVRGLEELLIELSTQYNEMLINKEKFSKNLKAHKKLTDDKKIIEEQIISVRNSMLHKLKKWFFGKDDSLIQIKDRLVQINNQIEDLLEHDKKINISLIPYPEVVKEIEMRLHERIEQRRKKIDLSINEQKIMEQQITVLNAELIRLKENLHKKQSLAKNIEKIQTSIKICGLFDEFPYAASLLEKLYAESSNVLDFYNDLNVLLDNTLRYKCFHLTMRLREYYFVQVTQELNRNEHKLTLTNKKTFKNTELYELHYLSLLYPLLVDTIHAFGKNLKQYVNNKNVILPNSINNIIVDEAGQISANIGFIPAWAAKRLICIGDTAQIKPVYPLLKKLDYLLSVKHKRITQKCTLDDFGTDQDGLHQVHCHRTSLMEIAQKLTKYKQYAGLSKGLYLVDHRRCPNEIIAYCNDNIYQGVLIPKTGTFKEISQKDKVWQKVIQEPWYFYGVDGEVNNKINENEIKAISACIDKMISESSELDWSNIGQHLAILTPYRNQADALLEYIQNNCEQKFRKGPNRLQLNDKASDTDLIIGTVHALQGAEKKIILFSLVDQNVTENSMIVREPSILNVAVSRSKLSILIFGSDNLRKSQKMEPLLKNITAFTTNEQTKLLLTV